MATRETELEMASRHVAEQKMRIARQEILIERLQDMGVPTGDALELLYEMQTFLEDMRAHVGRISK
ncbi:MAG: hypothetical protein WCA81_06250 [Rhizomicrobium sp.]